MSERRTKILPFLRSPKTTKRIQRRKIHHLAAVFFLPFFRCALSAVLLVSLSRLVVSLFERTCFDAQSGEREIAFYAGVLCGLCA